MLKIKNISKRFHKLMQFKRLFRFAKQGERRNGDRTLVAKEQPLVAAKWQPEATRRLPTDRCVRLQGYMLCMYQMQTEKKEKIKSLLQHFQRHYTSNLPFYVLLTADHLTAREKLYIPSIFTTTIIAPGHQLGILKEEGLFWFHLFFLCC